MFEFFKELGENINRIGIPDDRIFFGMTIEELIEYRKVTAKECLHIVDTEILTIMRENGSGDVLTIHSYVDNPTVTSLDDPLCLVTTSDVYPQNKE